MPPPKPERWRRIKFWILIHVLSPVVIATLHAQRSWARCTIRNARVIPAAVADRRSCIYALWHGDLVAATCFARFIRAGTGRALCAIVSPSLDGNLLTRVLAGLGIGAVRGSSASRAAGALKDAAAALRAGSDVVIALDGPRGPFHEVKLGALALARDTGAAVVPLHFRYGAPWRLGTWDRLTLARPFSRLELHVHEPLTVPADAGRGRLETLAAVLKSRCSQSVADTPQQQF